MHTVSGSFHSLYQGSFRLSLTVLVHYRSTTSIQPWRMVPPCSDRISRVPPYSIFRLLPSYTGLSPSTAPLPNGFYWKSMAYWADARSLAATCAISVDFFSSGYLDVSVRPVRFRNLWIQSRMTRRSGCPIRRSWVIRLLSAHPGFSQIATSFIACCRQGIHRVHLIT